jgi:hypothetical protein
MRQELFRLTPLGRTPEQTLVGSNLSRAFAKAQELLSRQAINLRDFIGQRYPREMVERDLAEVEKRKQGFRREGFKREATVFEAIVIDMTNRQPGWFGEGVRAAHTSEFDDVINGVDVVLEIPESGQNVSHLALGVDVTCGERELIGKFLEIRKKIARGELGGVKYSHSSDGELQGELSGIPHVIIGTDGEHLEGLIRAWVNNNTALSRDPIQMTFLAQILLQLETFIKYAESESVKQTEVAARLKQAQSKVQSIFERKQSQIKSTVDYAKQDRLVQAMLTALRSVFSGESLHF